VKNARQNGESVHISDLLPDPENRRKHNPRNVGMVVDALQRVGAARSIVIDEKGVILAGNGVVDAAAEAGIHRVQVIESDGSTLVAVRRRGLTDEQKRDLAISDNRTGELAEWDIEQLASDRADGLDLSPWFSENEQARLFQEADDPAAHYQGMPEFDQEDQEAWKTLKVHFASKSDLEAFSRLVNQTLTEKTRSIWFPPAEIGRYADKAYISEPAVSGLHSDEGPGGHALDDQGV
jgi:hypothetical protein